MNAVIDTGKRRKRSAPQGWLTQAVRLRELRFSVLADLQAPSKAVFWLIEQRKRRSAD
jgi:hypothetical protein